ncbi:MAG: hypothetical protein HYS75_00370 [Nitrosopumilales archaeon]|nr:hypothetical protein [Nitrosopumilales archaeon]
MKLFNSAKNSVDNKTVFYDESDEDKTDRLKNLLEKAAMKRNEEQKEEE